MLVLDLIYRDHKEGIETRERRIAIDVTVRNKCARWNSGESRSLYTKHKNHRIKEAVIIFSSRSKLIEIESANRRLDSFKIVLKANLKRELDLII